VVGESHLKKIETIIPEWWGIWVAKNSADKVEIRIIREPSKNQSIDLKALVRCLWKQEVLEIIKQNGLYQKKLDKAKRSVLWGILVDSITPNEIKKIVRNCLKRRDDWSIVLPQASNGD
jgi:hypothetical protein